MASPDRRARSGLAHADRADLAVAVGGRRSSCRHAEGRVVHAERPRDARGNSVAERTASAFAIVTADARRSTARAPSDARRKVEAARGQGGDASQSNPARLIEARRNLAARSNGHRKLRPVGEPDVWLRRCDRISGCRRGARRKSGSQRVRLVEASLPRSISARLPPLRWLCHRGRRKIASPHRTPLTIEDWRPRVDTRRLSPRRPSRTLSAMRSMPRRRGHQTCAQIPLGPRLVAGRYRTAACRNSTARLCRRSPRVSRCVGARSGEPGAMTAAIVRLVVSIAGGALRPGLASAACRGRCRPRKRSAPAAAPVERRRAGKPRGDPVLLRADREARRAGGGERLRHVARRRCARPSRAIPSSSASSAAAIRSAAPRERTRSSLGSGVIVDATGHRRHQQPRRRRRDRGEGGALRRARISRPRSCSATSAPTSPS